MWLIFTKIFLYVSKTFFFKLKNYKILPKKYISFHVDKTKILEDSIFSGISENNIISAKVVKVLSYYTNGFDTEVSIKLVFH